MFDFRKLAANLSFLVFGEIVSKILTFTAFALLARSFGPVEFGHLEFVLAVMIFSTLLVDFGANPLGSREVAKARERLGETVAGIVGMRAILTIPTYGLLLAFAFVFLWDKPQVRNLLLLYGLSLFFVPFFLQFVFQGLEKMKWVAICSIIRQTVFAGGVIVVVSSTRHLWMVPLIEIAAVFSLSLYCVYMLVFRVRATTGLKTDPRMLWSTFKEALPIGFSDITWAFMWYFATILLGLFAAGNEVGWFCAAHRPVITMHTFVWLYFCNLLPTISRSENEPKEVLDDLMRYSMSLMSWGTLFLGVVGLTMAEPLMVLVFGDKFSESAKVMKVLIWMIPLSSLGCHYRYILIGYGYQRHEFISQAAAAAASVVLGFELIPTYGKEGAAFSLIIAVSLYCVLVYVFVRTYIRRIPFLPYVNKPLLGAAGMLVSFLIINIYSLWIAIVFSSCLYIVMMVVLQPEVRKMRTMLVSAKFTPP